MTATPLRELAAEAKRDRDLKKRDEWLRRMKDSSAKEHVMVGEDVTLADVYRWLSEKV